MRISKPTQGPGPLPPLPGRSEVLVAEATLHLPYDDSGPAITRMITAWIAVDPSDDARRQARALAATFVAAKCTWMQPSSIDCDWLSALKFGPPIDHICASVALPATRFSTQSQIRRMLDAVCAQADDTELFAVGVAEQPTDWSELPLRAFVSTNEIGGGSLQVFDTLASLMAPGLTCALDLDDLECAFGSAEHPTLIEQATYLTDERRLSISDKSRSLLAKARRVAIMPTRYAGLAAEAHMARTVRDLSPTDSVLTFIGRRGLVADAIDPPLSVPVRIMCSHAPPAG